MKPPLFAVGIYACNSQVFIHYDVHGVMVAKLSDRGFVANKNVS
jgi:hypothetical protein